MQLNYFTYQGKKYPYKCLQINDNQHYYIIVSIVELEIDLVDDQGVPYNKEAEHLDNMIAYYVETVDELINNDDSILINKIYS